MSGIQANRRHFSYTAQNSFSLEISLLNLSSELEWFHHILVIIYSLFDLQRKKKKIIRGLFTRKRRFSKPSILGFRKKKSCKNKIRVFFSFSNFFLAELKFISKSVFLAKPFFQNCVQKNSCQENWKKYACRLVLIFIWQSFFLLCREFSPSTFEKGRFDPQEFFPHFWIWTGKIFSKSSFEIFQLERKEEKTLNESTFVLVNYSSMNLKWFSCVEIIFIQK